MFRHAKQFPEFYRRRLIQATALGTIMTGYYVYHLEPTPVTAISREQEKKLSKLTFDSVINQYRDRIVPSWNPIYKMVKSVTSEILKVAVEDGLLSNASPKIFMIDDEAANAFVLPSGDIFIFTGILPFAKDKDGMAAVLAHEIAHQIARHSAEKISVYYFFDLALTLLQVILLGETHNPFVDLAKNLILYLPYSRKCESEADFIGLTLMAKACFNPEAALELWKNMEQLKSQKDRNVPAILSTHPSNINRIDNIRKWLPQAARIYEANCGKNSNLFGLFKTQS